MISGKAGGTGDGTAVTERVPREWVIISREQELDLWVQARIPKAIEQALTGPYREIPCRSYIMDLVHLLEKR